MKKTISTLLAGVMLFTLSSCGGSAASVSSASANSESAPAAPSASPASSAISSEPEAPQSAEEPESESGKTLIAYFSWSGNTAQLAGMIAAKTGGELFAIEPETPYPDDYNATVNQAKTEQSENARPAVANSVENWKDYDTVFIGYPNWWSDVPMVLLTFMESHDWSGKTVIPFCTSGGGGFGNGINSIIGATAGAAVLDGFHVEGSSVANAQADVDAWINDLGLES